MKDRPKIVFHVGGPTFHPVRVQAECIITWIGDEFDSQICEGLSAFEALQECDLLVLMGLHWTGMTADGAGNLEYKSMREVDKQAFETYIASGRPLLNHHGAIASYDDWPRFGELLGFTWVWGTTTHSPIGEHAVRVVPTGHPIIANLKDYALVDELYYNVRISPGLDVAIHAETSWETHPAPMVMTAEGGRVAGAGRTVYLANGHDMRAFTSPAVKQLWINAIDWLLSRS
jgi:type 1 glutamine amidotransferase